ncbi:hypothetical protein HELRODRAFT_176442 [Helobdella robusta]|uniref:Uncharacterized protein n=1 Tax=Helobdella robusta TaxID=6412 RepID=T1FAI2_HELRO|nr:hypothetical protein HELRODRAFT_176442 [Helobdella robusta]ESN99684.1 hypothetical protein HELRODRAFT_176442 [Helobdella robusta]
MLDELAASLKNLNSETTTKSSKNSKLQKVLGQITVLVSDINDMSYINMPASLAKPYTATIVRPQQNLSANSILNKVPGLAPSWNQQQQQQQMSAVKTSQQMCMAGTTKTSVYSHVNQSGRRCLKVPHDLQLTFNLSSTMGTQIVTSFVSGLKKFLLLKNNTAWLVSLRLELQDFAEASPLTSKSAKTPANNNDDDKSKDVICID